jgi:DDE superfamily endonuclease
MGCVAELNREYIEKMEDVWAVYEKPYHPAEPVVCVDEKPVWLHADVRPPIPAAPGRMAKRDNEYQRCGTANVFCAVEPKAGRHFTWPTPHRSASEFAQALDRIVSSYPWARTIHRVMDNLNIHCRKSLTDYFGEEKGGALGKRLRVHYTPKQGSWLNQAEIESSLFSRQCLGRRRLATLAILRRETRAGNRQVNRNRVKINGGFTPQRARAKFGYNRNLLRRSKT